ncbi:MAG: hypothetical protein OXH87_06510 [Rhodospirillaceae bacterium]|nr:hypothetical protein [Rhodospirillaceae bacterium]
MVLTIDSRIFAEAQVQGITLHPVIGAYELRFGLLISVSATPEGEHCRAVIDGARVRMGTGGRDRDDLGFARSDRQLEIMTGPHQHRTAQTLSLTLQPGQLASIEKTRGAGDVQFELEVMGSGTDQRGPSPVQEVLRRDVPRSEWIEKLRAARARDILLLEVPLPLPDRSVGWQNISNELMRAESQFRNGDYHACVSACRVIAEELGCQAFGCTGWAKSSLDRLSSDRGGMSKREREMAMLGVLRHYTHLAHHGQSEGGEVSYSRADAQLILTLAASFVAHSRSN